jgi:hypothetical protein
MLKVIHKIKFIHVFWFFFYFLILAILIKGGFAQLDPDFGWHLKVGEEIATTHQIPHANLYNYTYTGNWVDHEWLSNLGIYYIYNNFGYAALVGLFSGLIVFVLIVLNIFLRKTLATYSFWTIAALQLFGTLASIGHFGVRIQELALLFVLIVLIIIEVYRRFKDWRILLLLPPLFFVWASLHASFLIGFFLLLSWIIINLFLYLVVNNKKFNFIVLVKPVRLKLLGIFSLFSGLSLLATFVTPYKLELYSFLIGYKNKAYLSMIQEWLPQYSFPFHYNQLIYLALGAAALIFYIYLQLKNKKACDLWRIFLVLVFLILSFKSRRHFPLFFIVSFSLMVEAYSQIFSEIKLAYFKWLHWLVIVCLGLVIIAQILAMRPTNYPFTAFYDTYPVDAVEFLKSNPQYSDDRILNSYGWGGFLIWVLPERKLFIDGRLPQVEFAGWTFIQEYFDFFGPNNKPKDKLNKYDISLVLIKSKDEPIYVKKWERVLFFIRQDILIPNNHLRKYLDSAVDWKIIYQDNTAIIYYRSINKIKYAN